MPGTWIYKDVYGRDLRLTEERLAHIRTAHLELADPFDYLEKTLTAPDRVVRSRTDPSVALFYRYFDTTPVTSKYLCVVIKGVVEDHFIVTLYFTDTIKKGEVLWTRP